MEEHVYPNEAALEREDDAADALIEELRARAKAEGLWAPHLPPEAGGTGRAFSPTRYLNEEIGRSIWAQLVFGCQAPDAGNGEILHLFGTDEQKERWLRPLVAGEIRSFFSMTEPEVSGLRPDDAADARRARRRRLGDRRPQVVLVAAPRAPRSGSSWRSPIPDAEPHRRASQIIVPADTPGVEIVRPISVLGHAGRGWTTHCEVRYTACASRSRTRSASRATASASRRSGSGPGRIHHVMRWLGQMQRAFELMCAHALEREAFGGPLADKQTVQNWIADSAAEIQACRLMTLDAAHKIDQGDEARVEISLIKFYAARVLNDVIDRAIQVHGALGLTDDTPLARDVRAWRAAPASTTAPTRCTAWSSRRRILKEFEEGGHWRFRVNRRVTLAARPVGAPAGVRLRARRGDPCPSRVPERFSSTTSTSPSTRTSADE